MLHSAGQLVQSVLKNLEMSETALTRMETPVWAVLIDIVNVGTLDCRCAAGYDN